MNRNDSHSCIRYLQKISFSPFVYCKGFDTSLLQLTPYLASWKPHAQSVYWTNDLIVFKQLTQPFQIWSVDFPSFFLSFLSSLASVQVIFGSVFLSVDLSYSPPWKWIRGIVLALRESSSFLKMNCTIIVLL